MLQPERPYMLAVEDPNDPDNDLGKGSYNIQKVRHCLFMHACSSPHACCCYLQAW
jgi:DNA polymerase sigma